MKNDWGTQSKVVVGAIFAIPLLIAFIACLLKYFFVALFLPCLTVLLALIFVRREVRQTSIHFEENQAPEIRLFVARVLVSYRAPLSQLLCESKATELEAKVTGAVDKIIERYKMPYDGEPRSVLIRACLMNIDYLTSVKSKSHSPLREFCTDAIFGIVIIVFSMHCGNSFWRALSVASFLVIIMVILRRKVIWPSKWREMDKEAKQHVDRSM